MYNINEILDSICDAKFTYKGNDKGTYEAQILPSYSQNYADKREAIRYALEEHLSDLYESIFKMQTDMGKLQAKVYTYESIIANSNFAPLITKGEEYVKNK